MNLMLFEIFAESFSDSLRSAVAAVKSFNPLEVDGLMSAANGLAWNEVAGAGGATGWRNFNFGNDFVCDSVHVCREIARESADLGCFKKRRFHHVMVVVMVLVAW